MAERRKIVEQKKMKLRYDAIITSSSISLFFFSFASPSPRRAPVPPHVPHAGRLHAGRVPGRDDNSRSRRRRRSSRSELQQQRRRRRQ